MPKSSTSKVSRKKNKEGILDLKTVNECNKCLGAETLHPQASVINLDGADLRQAGVKFEFYAVLLIDECADGCCCCGRRYYDFATATMVFLTPGEVFRLDAAGALPPKGLLLAFHPDLLFRTALNRHINDYTFFFYRKEEALHLSQRERRTVVKYFDDINEELHHPIDAHSRTLVSRLIELLLDYCTRYYERQLITRENKNRDLMGKLGRLVDHGIPVSNQSVLLKGINDDPAVMAELCAKLQRARVRPYYIFLCDPIAGIGHFRTDPASAPVLRESLLSNLGGLACPRLVADLPGAPHKQDVLGR